MLKTVSAAPESGFEKYLALGQISSGKESLEFYSKAASLLSGLLEDLKQDPNVAEIESQLNELKRQLSDIYCSAAELYMTDLCFEEGAEAACESLIVQAQNVDPSNPEVFRVMSDLRLTQCRGEEAKESISHCLDLISAMSVESPDFPSYEQRSAVVRVLVELGLFAEATVVLEGLLAEDEKIVETWYLLGIAQKGLDDKEGAIEAFVSALALMFQEPEDPELKESIFGFLQEIGVDGPKIWAELEQEIANGEIEF